MITPLSYIHTHKRVDIALCPNHKPTHRAPRRLTAVMPPLLSTPAQFHPTPAQRPLHNTPRPSENTSELLASTCAKMSLGCTATPATALLARGGVGNSSPYHVSGVDVGAEGEEDEDFLENAPSGGFDELPRRLALGARD